MLSLKEGPYWSSSIPPYAHRTVGTEYTILSFQKRCEATIHGDSGDSNGSIVSGNKPITYSTRIELLVDRPQMLRRWPSEYNVRHNLRVYALYGPCLPNRRDRFTTDVSVLSSADAPRQRLTPSNAPESSDSCLLSSLTRCHKIHMAGVIRCYYQR